MTYRVLLALGTQVVVFAAILGSLVLLTWLLVSDTIALRLLELAVKDLLGIWVWPLGWGLAMFIRREGPAFANDLLQVLQESQPVATATGLIERSTYHRSSLPVTIPVTLLGLVLTVSYEVPIDPSVRWLVVLGISSIYYVGAFILWHFVGVIRAFNVLYSALGEVRFREDLSPASLESALNYLTLTTTVGVASIYAGFRGTLTGGFVFPHEFLKTLLVTPLVLFLPATLLYNFHPRYVLRRILQHSLFRAMRDIREADPEHAREVLLEIRDLTMTNAQVLPFMDYKSLPSYVIAVLFVLSLAYHNDPIVQGFFTYLLGFQGE